MTNPDRPTHGSNFLYILGFLVFALIYWLLFYVGSGSTESLELSRTSWDIMVYFKQSLIGISNQSLGSLNGDMAYLRSEYGVRGLLEAAPLVFLYGLLKPGEWANQVLALGSAALSLVLLFQVSNQHFGKRAALAACVLWATLPTHVVFTSQIGAHSTLYLALLIALLTFNNAKVSGGRWPLVISLLATGIVLLLNVWAGFSLLAIFGLSRLSKQHEKIAQQVIPWMFIPLLGLIFWPTLSSSLVDFYTHWISSPGNALFAVLLLMAIFYLSTKRITGFASHLLISGFFLAAMLIGLVGQSETANQSMALLLCANLYLCALIGAFIADKLPGTIKAQDLLVSAGLVLLLGFVFVNTQRILIPATPTLQLTPAGNLRYLFQIMAGLMIVVAIVLPALSDKLNSRKGDILFAGFLVILGLAWMPANWDVGQKERARHFAAEQAYEDLLNENARLPVYIVGDESLFDHFLFLQSNNRNQPMELVAVAFDRLDLVESGYLVYWDQEFPVLAKDWAFIDYAGQMGQPRLGLARQLNPIKAQEELMQAQTDWDSDPNLASNERLFAAQVNAGESCKDVKRYVSYLSSAALLTKPVMVVFPNSEDCPSEMLDNQNELLLDYQNYHLVYISVANQLTRDDGDGYVRISINKNYFDDPRKANLLFEVEPNSVYYYGTTLRSKDNALALYWQLGGVEGYAFAGSYPEFTELGTYLITADFEGTQTLSLSPVLFNGFGNYDISFLAFSKVELP